MKKIFHVADHQREGETVFIAKSNQWLWTGERFVIYHSHDLVELSWDEIICFVLLGFFSKQNQATARQVDFLHLWSGAQLWTASNQPCREVLCTAPWLATVGDCDSRHHQMMFSGEYVLECFKIKIDYFSLLVFVFQQPLQNLWPRAALCCAFLPLESFLVWHSVYTTHKHLQYKQYGHRILIEDKQTVRLIKGQRWNSSLVTHWNKLKMKTVLLLGSMSSWYIL